MRRKHTNRTAKSDYCTSFNAVDIIVGTRSVHVEMRACGLCLQSCWKDRKERGPCESHFAESCGRPENLADPRKKDPRKVDKRKRHWASGKLAVALATLRRGWEVAWCGRVVGWVWGRGVRGEGVAVQAQVATHYTTCAHSFPDSCTLNVQGNSPNKPLLNQGEGKGRVWQARSASKSPTRFCSPAFPSALSRCVCRE